MNIPPFPTSATMHNDMIDEDYAEATPIKAYVIESDEEEEGDEEVEALNVDVLPSREEAAQSARSNLKRYCIIGTVVIILLATAIMVPVYFTVLKIDIDISQSPTAMPSLQPSSAPTTVLFTEYVDKAAQISNRTLLVTPGTVQYKAIYWIYHSDPFGRRDIDDDRLLQRYIAAVFYFSTSMGRGWADCYPGDVACTSNSKKAWFGPWDECEWYGFTECDEEGFVTRFIILNNQNGEGKTVNGNDLHGTLPSEMGYMTSLTHLTIARNPLLVSTIPSSFSNLTRLRRLTLILNNLHEPWNANWMENMTDLTEMYLNYNDFKMPLPKDIAQNNTGLTGLGLAGNKIYGSIPTEYGSFYKLKKLELSDNTLTGRIPAQLFPSDTHSGLPALEFLDLEENFLNETLPIEIGNMTFLYSLRLSNNNFSGVIPSTIGNIGMNDMNRQIDIRLNGNKFSGEIPDSLGDIRKLYILDLRDNMLTGGVSEDICTLRNGTLRNLAVDCDKVACDCCSPTCEAAESI